MPDAAVIHSHEYSPASGCGAASTRPGRCGRSTAGSPDRAPLLRNLRGNVMARLAVGRASTATAARPPARERALGVALAAAPRRAVGRDASGRSRRPASRAAVRASVARSAGAGRPDSATGAVGTRSSWLPSRPCQLQPSAASGCRWWSRVRSARRSPSPRSRCTRSRSAPSILGVGSAATRSKALDDISFAVQPGRVLRDRRAQRQRQEHAAEVPGRDLPGRRRHLVPGAAVDVHRAGRRLQPGPGGSRQRRHERDHARPLAPRGAQAL